MSSVINLFIKYLYYKNAFPYTHLLYEKHANFRVHTIYIIRYYANVMIILLVLTFCIAISSEILLAHYSVEKVWRNFS